ncbi:MAG: Protein of unknown function (DUF3616) [Phormidesmis priestleyi Ana]|uniref:DUF3616 domain-containing protein n=1 Tax=Phormidesmis priestleyi Ana TaxID=1666911 RepID=A0A0P8C2C9_9CYAN|nr:MAG: Protein of unknown function (DUF3616) [Phormidesmis priestleyi Ana]
MPNSFLLSRVLLQFDSPDADLSGEISAIARTPDGSLWLGSDELTSIERLSPTAPCIYGNHQRFAAGDLIKLFDADSEIDIEGMDYSDGYLWLVGSHSAKRNQPKGKKYKKDIQALAEIETDANRYLLARVPVINGQLVKSYQPSNSEEDTLTAALLRKTKKHNMLMEALAQDEHIGPFVQMRLPSKDNGLDIEGLAVLGNRVYLGLRGPVLRGRAIILELELEESEPGVLTAKEIGDKGEIYRKHFVDLNGLGVRELCLRNNNLIILAGPTMELEGAMQVFQVKNLPDHSNHTIWEQSEDALSVLFDLPFIPGVDHAEGLALFPCLGYDDALMVVYDSPSDERRVNKKSLFADVFRMPNLDD